MATTPLPIVILHKGNPFYLSYCLRQTRYVNPENPLYLIGDETNAGYADVTHEQIVSYQRALTAIAGVYRHLSSQPTDYELFCIQRWFVLLAFMKRHNLARCIHLDSDVLPYARFTEDAFPYGDRIAMCHFIPHCTYIGSIGALEDFCTYCLRCYTDPAYLKKLTTRYQNLLDGNEEAGFAGVSDMTLFEMYSREDESRIPNLFYRSYTVLPDDNINTGSEFELNWFQATKKLRWKNNRPYAMHAATGREVQLTMLHCQGIAKQKMPYWATFPGRRFSDVMKYSYRQFVKEIYRYFRYRRFRTT